MIVVVVAHEHGVQLGQLVRPEGGGPHPRGADPGKGLARFENTGSVMTVSPGNRRRSEACPRKVAPSCSCTKSGKGGGGGSTTVAGQGFAPRSSFHRSTSIKPRAEVPHGLK